MGVKKLKEHYNIKYIVQVYEYISKPNTICIGSAYVHDLIELSMDGKIIKVSSIVDRNRHDEAIVKILNKLEADGPDLVAKLINEPDTFKDLKPVYIYSGGRIYKKYCEEFGWPNCTTDGMLMYENTSFMKRGEAWEYAKKSTKIEPYDWKNTKNNIKESFVRIWKNTVWFLDMVLDWLYIRTIGRWRNIVRK